MLLKKKNIRNVLCRITIRTRVIYFYTFDEIFFRIEVEVMVELLDSEGDSACVKMYSWIFTGIRHTHTCTHSQIFYLKYKRDWNKMRRQNSIKI